MYDAVTLAERGWTTCPDCKDLRVLASSLSNAIPATHSAPTVSQVRIRERSTASPNSLSGRFGKGQFPFHTDFAHHPVSPHYVILRYVGQAVVVRSTLLLDIIALPLSSRQRATLRRQVWCCRGSPRFFYSRILSDSTAPGTQLHRFDLACMTPARPSFRESADIMLEAINGATPVVVSWQPDLALILDNWRMLHARSGDSLQSDSQRVLERVAVS